MPIRPLYLAVPTALVAAAGIAWLTSATASDGGSESAPQVAQAAPPAANPPATGGGVNQPSDRHERTFSPRDMCQEKTARRIGNRAYLKARLDLKPEQMAAWNTFEKAADAANAKDMTFCSTLPTEIKTPSNFADRFSMREGFIKQRAETLEAVKPSLLALYAALTPEQKAIMDGPVRGGHFGHRHGRG
jgi:hypothetical protein